MTGSIFPYRVWIPLVVFAMAFGGILAYQLAEPTRRSSGPISIDGSWSALTSDRFAATMQAVTDRLDTRVQYESATRDASLMARKWSRMLPAGSASRAQLETSYAPDATSNPVALAAWVSGFPITLTTIRQSGDATLTGTGAGAVVRVPLVMSVRVRQATRASRVFRTPIDVTLRPQLPIGEDDLTKASWKVQDATTSQQDGLRALKQPIIIQRENVDLVVDAAHRRVAPAIADQAQQSMVLLKKRYAATSGPSHVAIFLLDGEDQAAKVLGTSSRKPAGVEPAGWTWENGDVVLLTQSSSSSYAGTVRHEMTHVVTLPLLRSGNVPTMLMEGIAVNEEARLVMSKDSRSYIDLTSLRTAFRNGTLHYDQLLRSRESFFGRSTSADVDLAYLAGYATVSYLEDVASHEQVDQALVALSRGVPIDRVLARAKLTPATLQKHVRVWTANYMRTHAAAPSSQRTNGK